jgi:hypothetical protein
MFKRFVVIFSTVLFLTGTITLLPAGFASAAPIHSKIVKEPMKQLKPLLCQSTPFTITLTPFPNRTYNWHYCSGSYTLNVNMIAWFANGAWSGYMYINEGYGEFWLGFCNGDSYTGNGTIYSLYLSPTKETWCS